MCQHKNKIKSNLYSLCPKSSHNINVHTWVLYTNLYLTNVTRASAGKFPCIFSKWEATLLSLLPALVAAIQVYLITAVGSLSS